MIPSDHLFENEIASNNQHMRMKMKYAIEAKVDVRILWVDVYHKKCLVKAKKSIVKADES